MALAALLAVLALAEAVAADLLVGPAPMAAWVLAGLGLLAAMLAVLALVVSTRTASSTRSGARSEEL